MHIQGNKTQKIFDKIIFCHKEHVDRIFGGLRIFDNSNKTVLSQLTKEFVEIPLQMSPSRWGRAFRTIRGIFRNYTNDDYDKITKEIDPIKKILLFVSHSQYGTLIKEIKKKYPFVITASYFHNIEITMAYNRLIFYKKPLPLFEILRDYRNEMLCAKYSDEVYLLNRREEILFKKFYSKRDVNICSVALPDKNERRLLKEPSGKLKLLFVGTYFWGNIPGLEMFINEVMPEINADLFVVGKDMERIQERTNIHLPNVHYIGRVTDDELNSYYLECDIFVAPIVAGGGMKTKVAEAMMYGMPIIGTTEAFCGYEIDIEEIGFCSDNISDYKGFIEELDKNRNKITVMSQRSRDYYSENYSVKNALNVYRSTLLK